MTPRPTRSVRAKSLTPAVAAALAFAGLSFLPSAHAQISSPGFTLAGPGPTEWTLNGNAAALAAGRPAIVNNELLLTAATNDNATSAWYNTPQGLSNFTASFTYNFLGNNPTTQNPADGFAFVLQNNGLTALGQAGGGLGYIGGNLGNTSSVALAFDLWNNNNGTGATGITRSGAGASGYGGFVFSDTTPVALRAATPVNVNIAYRDGVFTETLTQGANTITKSFNINVANRVGPTGFVGFTGGTGGANADQKITNFSLTLGNAPAVPAAAQAIAGVPQGSFGMFGIREVMGAPACCGNLAETEAAILGAHSNRIDYEAPVLNLYDSDVNGRFGNDSFYRLDPNQVDRGTDTVNNIAVVATGTIRIPTAGVYTFGTSSDDGFRITIAGHRFETSFGQGGTAINANGALEFAAGRGAGDVSGGTIFLPAGDHKIQMLNWEGGGGASVELWSAPGARGGFDPAVFTLVGGPDIPTKTGRNRVLQVGQWTLKEYSNVNNVTEVIGHALNNTGTQRGATSTVPTIRYMDPSGNNSGSHGADALAFPNDTLNVDDNNYGAFATTTLTIAPADAGRYTFAMYADDDSRFRLLLGGVPVTIAGASGTGVSLFDSNNDAINDQFGTNGCCNDLFGKYDLVAGTYTIEAAFHEGGGGSGFFLYGTQGDRDTFDPAAFQLLGANVDGAPWTVQGTPALDLVPEPGSVSLLGLAALGIMARRRRQQG